MAQHGRYYRLKLDVFTVLRQEKAVILPHPAVWFKYSWVLIQPFQRARKHLQLKVTTPALLLEEVHKAAFPGAAHAIGSYEERPRSKTDPPTPTARKAASETCIILCSLHCPEPPPCLAEWLLERFMIRPELSRIAVKEALPGLQTPPGKLLVTI